MPGTFSRKRHIYSMHHPPNMGLSIRRRVVVLSTVSMLIAATVILGSAYLFTLRILAYQRGYDNTTSAAFVEPRKGYILTSTTSEPPRLKRQAMFPMPEPLPTPLPDVPSSPVGERRAVNGSSTASTTTATLQEAIDAEARRTAEIASQGRDEVDKKMTRKSAESDGASKERLKNKRASSKEAHSEDVESIHPGDQIKVQSSEQQFESLRQHPKDTRLRLVEAEDEQHQRGVGSLEVTDRGHETILLPTTGKPLTTGSAATQSAPTTSDETRKEGDDKTQRPLKSEEDIGLEQTATTVPNVPKTTVGSGQIDLDPLIARFVANRHKGLLFNPDATKFDNVVEFDADDSGDPTTTTTTTSLPSTATPDHQESPRTKAKSKENKSSESSTSSQESSEEQPTSTVGFARGAVEGSPTTTAPTAVTTAIREDDKTVSTESPLTTTPESTSHSPTLPSSEVLLANVNPETPTTTIESQVTSSAEAGSLIRTRLEDERRKELQNWKLTPKTVNHVLMGQPNQVVTERPYIDHSADALVTSASGNKHEYRPTELPETSSTTTREATSSSTTPEHDEVKTTSTTATSDSVVDKVKEAVSSFTSSESATTTSIPLTTTESITSNTIPFEHESISTATGPVASTESVSTTSSTSFTTTESTSTTTSTPFTTTESTTTSTAAPTTDEVETTSTTTTTGKPIEEETTTSKSIINKVADSISSLFSRQETISTTTTEVPLTDRISSEIARIQHVTTELPLETTQSSTSTRTAQTTNVPVEGTSSTTSNHLTSTPQQPSEDISSTPLPETQWYLGNVGDNHPDRLKYFGSRSILSGESTPSTEVPLTASTPVPVPVTSTAQVATGATISTASPTPSVVPSTVPPVNPLPQLVTPDSISTQTPLIHFTPELLSSTIATSTPLPNLITPEVTLAVPVMASGLHVNSNLAEATSTAVPLLASGIHAVTQEPPANLITIPVSTSLPPVTPAALAGDLNPAILSADLVASTSAPVTTTGPTTTATTDTDYVTMTTTPGAVSNTPALALPPHGLPPLPFIAPGDVLIAPQNIHHEVQSDQPVFHHQTEELKDPESTLPVVSKVTPNNEGDVEEIIRPSTAYKETAQAMPLKEESTQTSHRTSTPTAVDQLKANTTQMAHAIQNSASELKNASISRWNQFKRRWSDSKEFVLTNTGIALMVSVLQFISAAVLVSGVKDSMSELKTHRWAQRWIVFNWILFIILIGCFITFVAMGSDPEKQFGHQLVVPANEVSSVKPDHLDIGFISRSVSSHLYTYLVLADIIVLFLLMVLTSYYLRNHTIHHIHLEHGVHH